MQHMSLKKKILFRKLDRMTDEEFLNTFNSLSYDLKRDYNEYCMNRLIDVLSKKIKQKKCVRSSHDEVDQLTGN